MPNTIELYERLTHQYRAGWSYLDEEQYIGTAKILAYRKTRDEGPDGNNHLTRVIAPTSLRHLDLSRAIKDTLSGTYCQHEHDCCRCPSTYAYVRRVSAREYAVTLCTTYNL